MDLKQLASKVSTMRQAQAEYFTLIGKARKTKSGVDFAAAATTLKRSKAIEGEVDQVVSEILNA